MYPHIFISSFKPAKDKSVLDSFKITSVLVLKDEKETFIKEYFKDLSYLTIHLENSVYTNLLPTLKISNEFLSNQISGGRNVLVHCLGGISRVFVGAYL